MAKRSPAAPAQDGFVWQKLHPHHPRSETSTESGAGTFNSQRIEPHTREERVIAALLALCLSGRVASQFVARLRDLKEERLPVRANRARVWGSILDF